MTLIERLARIRDAADWLKKPDILPQDREVGGEAGGSRTKRKGSDQWNRLND